MISPWCRICHSSLQCAQRLLQPACSRWMWSGQQHHHLLRLQDGIAIVSFGGPVVMQLTSEPDKHEQASHECNDACLAVSALASEAFQL